MKPATRKEKLAVCEVKSRGYKWNGECWESKHHSVGSSLGYHYSAIVTLEMSGFSFDGRNWIEPDNLPDHLRESDFPLYCAVLAIAFILGVIGFCVWGGV